MYVIVTRVRLQVGACDTYSLAFNRKVAAAMDPRCGPYEEGMGMQFGTEQVGPRGLFLLATTGVAGVVLAVHGFAHGPLAASTSITTPTSVAATPKAPSAPAHHPTTTTSPSSSTSTSTHQKLGPALATTQYAPYAYQLYPGPQSAQARSATAGFQIKVTSGPTTITVTVSGAGVAKGTQTLTYPTGDKVYFIEASFGDDSTNAEYNLGDDGLVVTNASGRIVE